MPAGATQRTPTGVAWLEEQTGEQLERPTETVSGRHLSIRVPMSLADELEIEASAQGETMSQAARRLLTESLRRRREPGQQEIDAAIASLEALRKRL